MRQNLSVALALVEEFGCYVWVLVFGFAALCLISYSLVSAASGFAYINMAVQHGRIPLGFPYAHFSHSAMKGALWFAYAILVFILGLNSGRLAYNLAYQS